MPEHAGVPLTIVDAFTEEAFAGNPAAVCLLDRWPDDAGLQRVAAELNLAETAFVVAREEPEHFDLRWFTPAGRGGPVRARHAGQHPRARACRDR